MRVTHHNYAVFKALRGKDWQSAGTIASQIGIPARNLKTTLAKLVHIGVIEANELVRPVLYRPVAEPSAKAQEFIDQIEQTAPIFEKESRMKPDDPKKAIGYSAFIIEGKLWQGLRLHEIHRDLGRETLVTLREALSVVGDAPIPMEMSLTSTTIASSPYVAQKDQHILGNLCSAFVDSGEKNEWGEASIYAGAIAELTGERYFFVYSRDARGGRYTTFKPYPAMVVETQALLTNKLPSEVMDGYLDKDEEVGAIKKKLMATIFKGKKGHA